MARRAAALAFASIFNYDANYSAMTHMIIYKDFQQSKLAKYSTSRQNRCGQHRQLRQ
jgi:hypothetical protein